MIGLYILVTNVLEKFKTIKFGMSMRLEYRWIDYLQIFNDSKYIYYYEFNDIMSREQIIQIESEIINLHLNERNYDFQTEYFYSSDYNNFHQTIINILDKYKIKYNIHDKHNFIRTYYDSNPEKLEPDEILNKQIEQLTQQIQQTQLNRCKQLISLDRFGQKESFETFKQMICLDYYWGLMIAPTGWGKSMIHLLFMNYYLSNNPTLNCILLTKKKDLLSDINNDIDSDLDKLLASELIKTKPNILYCVNKSFDPNDINNLSRQSIIIINIDKLINKNHIENQSTNDPFTKIKLIDWSKIGLIIFDEVHHIGSKCVFELMNYLKYDIKLKYCIGSSATPVRNNFSNQNNVRLLFNKENNQNNILQKTLTKEDVNILYEISYKEAWIAQIILKVRIELILINKQSVNFGTNIDKKIIGFQYTNEGKQQIISKIIDVLAVSFRKKIIFYTSNRLSCLEWYETISNDIQFNAYSKHISFSINNSTIDEEDKSLDSKVNMRINKLNITNKQLTDGITNFKSEDSCSMLFVVAKATEGFNDKLVDIVFNLDPIIDRSIVLELQKMGRTTRTIADKKVGIYISPIIQTENYLDDMSNFMADFIKTICKPISDKTSIERPHTKKEYDEIYKQIFSIDGFDKIDSEIIYDLVLKKSSPELTYSNCIKIIKNSSPKPTTKKEYIELCKIDTRLSTEPDILFGSKFDWIEYLSIDRIYYELDECKTNIQQFLKSKPELKKHYLNPIIICNELCEFDNRFPPNDLFIEYYNLKQLNDIIKITHSVKKKGAI